MSMPENILTICSTVFHITLKVDDEEGRLFKDIQVSTFLGHPVIFIVKLYHFPDDDQ